MIPKVKKALSDAEIRQHASSVFAEHAHPSASERYSFINTSSIVDMLRRDKMYPVQASQSRVRDGINNGYQRHMVRFRKDVYFGELEVGDSIPELVLINGHNTRVPLQFHLGLFRLACSNGAIVKETDFGSFNVKHVSINQESVSEIVEQYVSKADTLLNKIGDYKKISLAKNEQLVFAQKVHNRVWPKGHNLPYETLLKARRDADAGDSLWNVFNVVQENIIKGGIGYDGPKRRTKTKAVKNIQRDVEINTAIWEILYETYLSKK